MHFEHKIKVQIFSHEGELCYVFFYIIYVIDPYLHNYISCQYYTDFYNKR